MLEDVGDAKGRRKAFNPAFQKLQIRSVAEAHGIETVSFAPGNVAGSRAARWVGVLVVADQRLPVSITGSLD
jgi:hypothetical protein